VLAATAIPFVALAPGVAMAMDMQNENVNDTPAIYEEVSRVTETPEDVAKHWATENGAEVSWAETVDGIEMGIGAAVDAKKRRDEQN
jgi:hypothetical protein